MKLLRKSATIFFLLICLCACTNRPSPAPTNSVTESTVVSHTPEPRQVSTSSSVLASPAIDLTPSPAAETTEPSQPTIPPEARLTINCLEVQDSLPPEAVFDGYLLLYGAFDPHDRSDSQITIALDMQTHQSIRLSAEGELFLGFAVSLDQGWIAYHQVSREQQDRRPVLNRLVISDALGQIRQVIPWENEEWHFPIAWLDNKWLTFADLIKERSFWKYNFMVMNPYTGERQLLIPDFPGMRARSPVISWNGWGISAYSPTLEHVVYLQGEDFDENNYYVLWNVENEQPLVSLDVIDTSAIPRWSPDGDRFALAPEFSEPNLQQPSDELYTIDVNGSMVMETNLGAYYRWVFISDYSWAPDGNSIAFWYAAWQDEQPNPFTPIELSLAVLNLETGQVVTYCIPGNSDLAIYGPRLGTPPLWSPDGKQLVVLNEYSDDHMRTNIHKRVILVDLITENAYLIAENAEPIGWLK